MTMCTRTIFHQVVDRGNCEVVVAVDSNKGVDEDMNKNIGIPMVVCNVTHTEITITWELNVTSQVKITKQLQPSQV